MGYARKNLVSLQDTPYYHVIARCVRRAWLWGHDENLALYTHQFAKRWMFNRQFCSARHCIGASRLFLRVHTHARA
jgi:putative transposase